VYLKKGDDVPQHSHHNEQLTYILEGALHFWFGENGEREFTVKAGEVVVIWMSSVGAIRAAFPDMRARRSGRMIVITSIAAREPVANLMLSNSLRAGLHGLINTLSKEVAGDQVTVNALMPGYTLTERLEEPHLDEVKLAAQIPARRLGHGTLPLLRPFSHPIRRGMSPVRPSRATAVCYSRFDSPPNRRQSGRVLPIE